MSTTRRCRSTACSPRCEGAKKLRLVILDACRENPVRREDGERGTTRSVGRGLARIEPEAGVLVAYSAKDGQVAQDGDGTNSPFAESLLKYLDEPGLEINMLFRRVHDDVKTRTGGQQSPSPMARCRPRPSYFNGRGHTRPPAGEACSHADSGEGHLRGLGALTRHLATADAERARHRRFRPEECVGRAGQTSAAHREGLEAP